MGVEETFVPPLPRALAFENFDEGIQASRAARRKNLTPAALR